MRKRIYKSIAIFSLTLMCNFVFFNVVLAENTVNVKTINENVSEKTYEYDLSIPEVSGMKDSQFQDSLNKKIKNELEKNKQEVIKRSIDDFKYANEKKYHIQKYTFKSKYNVTTSNNILSLTTTNYIYVGGEYPIKSKRTYNIDLNNNKLLKLNDVASCNNIERIEDEVNRNIKSNSKYYKREVEKNIGDETNFYVDKSNTYIYFDMNEIGPYTIGVPEFKFEF